MNLESLMSAMPFARHLGMEVEHAADGEATVRLPLAEEHSSLPDRVVAHGGVVHALADTAGGAAVISLHGEPTPTVDIRFDHLAPATDDLVATAEVLRNGDSVAVAEMAVEDVEGTRVAVGRGVYKTGSPEGPSAWGSDPESSLGD